ncbi:hypothetical protein VB715_12315 [Crocosphaera sp. UHCC 0190]|uniref:hypothetical protein n=1 Tax=Crocosphaera sp. UHCC 0190 TaxID=3110246 RepID=UPI002B1FCEED|nr:hypothetical protein [Crocosphaera sp. UHCC 0190]MEA5510549.1 hypothetical protein [Crocosphaera sp. UHCC 0190]
MKKLEQVKYFNNPTAQLEPGVEEIKNIIKRHHTWGKPFALHALIIRLLKAVWILYYETELVTQQVSPQNKEAIISAVSKVNQCPFCASSHTANDVKQALDSKALNLIPNKKKRLLVKWSLATLSPEAKIVQSPPFSRKEAPEIITTAILFHYLNRMLNIFLPQESEEENFSKLNKCKQLKGQVFGWLKNQLRSRTIYKPGASLNLLPRTALPEDLKWARGNPTVANALAQFAATVEQEGQAVLSESVQELVKDYLKSWDGNPPPLGTYWVEEAIETLDDSLKPEARLAMLTAIASYQVSEPVVRQFRKVHPFDRELLAATSWASFAAARQIGGQLTVPSV